MPAGLWRYEGRASTDDGGVVLHLSSALMNRRTRPICLVVIAAAACNSDTSMTDRSKYPTATEEQLKGAVRTTLDHPEPKPSQLARRNRSLAVLKQLGVPYLATLPVTEAEGSFAPREVREIAERALAVAIAAVKGESNDHAFAQKLVSDYKARSLFTPKELAFIENPEPPRQQLVDYSWGYEALHVLLWSLGHVEDLKAPNQICDVAAEVAIVRENGREGLVAQAKLRSASELLDKADLYYHLHWSAIELRLRSQSSSALDEGIVRERHHALNWLIRYMNQEWDDVRTDT